MFTTCVWHLYDCAALAFPDFQFLWSHTGSSPVRLNKGDLEIPWFSGDQAQKSLWVMQASVFNQVESGGPSGN
jgi:hypothetical protein